MELHTFPVLTNQKNKLYAAVCGLCLMATTAYGQVSFQGYTIYDCLGSAVHPNGCNTDYVLGPPDDSIWVNLADGLVATGNFCLPWQDVPGNELLLETGYHQSNYNVRLKLSNGQYSAPHAVSVGQWTQIPNVAWYFAHSYCTPDTFPSVRYILPLDFSTHFGLGPTDVVTGIEITFLITTGVADLAGVYIIASPSGNTHNHITDTTVCAGQPLILDASRPGATYSWQDNSTNATFNVTQQGTYWVQVTSPCGGITRDTFNVIYITAPSVSLGNDTTLCPGATLPLNVTQPGATYLWQDNSTSATFNVTQAGTYWVRVTNQCGSTRDTIAVAHASLPTADLGNDTTLCPAATMPLNVSQSGAIYLWQDNSTNAIFNVTQQGVYWVQVTNQCGSVRDTINVTFTSLPTANLGNNTSLCPGASLLLNATQPNATYLWQNNSTNATFNVTQAGAYWVQVTNQCGSAADTIGVTSASLPTADLGNDTMLCPGVTLPLNVSQSNATYLWQDNSTNATFNVTQQGVYWVRVTTQCGVISDTVNVTYASLPTVNLGNNTTLCPGATLPLNVSQSGATYLWQNNSTNSTFTVTQAGVYSVQVTNQCGATSDTITVAYASHPTVDLGNDTTLCPGATLLLNVSQPGATYLWQDNSTNATFNATQAGIYWVRVTTQCGSTTDTIHVSYASLPTADLGNDTTLCPSATLLLNVNQSGATYLWQDNSTNATFDVTQAGVYWVRVTTQCGSTMDTIHVSYASLSTADLGNDTTLCPGSTLPLNVSQPSATYLWQDNSTTATFNVTQAGIYWVRVTTQCGSTMDTIHVSYASLPTADLGNDTTLCPSTTLLLNVSQQDATYLWQDNSTNATFNVTQQGVYWVRVTTLCGSTADTIEVTYNSLPAVNLGSDTALCAGETLALDVSFPDAAYLWQDNSTDATFIVSQPGTYWVQAINSCGSSLDSIAVTYKALPLVNLGRDTAICKGQILKLNVALPNATYLWQDNSTNATFDVTQPGIYWVQVSGCGTTSDSLIVSPDEVCGCPLFLPNAFSPNGDGVHDLFKASCDCEITNYHIVIFSRWGEKIFETRDINNSWNAIYKGKRVPTEVYVYFVEYTVGSKVHTKKGNITVVR